MDVTITKVASIIKNYSTMSKSLKYLIVWAFYITAFILCLEGTSAVFGVPLGIIGVMLQRHFNINID